MYDWMTGRRGDGDGFTSPSYNFNLNPPENYWNGNKFVVPGAPGMKEAAMAGGGGISGQGMSELLQRLGARGGGGMGGGYDPRMGKQWNMPAPPQQDAGAGGGGGMAGLLGMLGQVSPVMNSPIAQHGIGGQLMKLVTDMKSGDNQLGTWLNQLLTGKGGASNAGFRSTPDGSPLGYYVRQ